MEEVFFDDALVVDAIRRQNNSGIPFRLLFFDAEFISDVGVKVMVHSGDYFWSGDSLVTISAISRFCSFLSRSIFSRFTSFLL